MAELLVSVRSAAEARSAVAGGAGVIDVKEPVRGSLGRAEVGVVEEVLDAVAGQRPVSAALGELREWVGETVPVSLERLAFVKWGLAGAARDWRDQVDQLRRRVESASACRVVLTAYADHGRAEGPSPVEVCRHAIAQRYAVMLVDTFGKDGTTLLDWLSVEEVGRLVAECREGGVGIALAGSLGLRDVETLLPLRPDWFAVRGAVCVGGRGGEIDGVRVRELAQRLSWESAKR